jgi:hypothetical protein
VDTVDAAATPRDRTDAIRDMISARVLGMRQWGLAKWIALGVDAVEAYTTVA